LFDAAQLAAGYFTHFFDAPQEMVGTSSCIKVNEGKLVGLG